MGIEYTNNRRRTWAEQRSGSGADMATSSRKADMQGRLYPELQAGRGFTSQTAVTGNAGLKPAAAPVSDAVAASSAGPMQARAAKPKKNQPSPSPEWTSLASAQTSGGDAAVTQAYDQISVDQRNTMTPAQVDDFSEYIDNSTPVNAFLRYGTEDPTGHKKALASSLHKAMPKTQTDLRGYKGVSDLSLARLLSSSKDKELRSVVGDDGITIDHKRLWELRDRMKGLTFKERGFTSTSLNESVADRYRGSQLKLRDAVEYMTPIVQDTLFEGDLSMFNDSSQGPQFGTGREQNMAAYEALSPRDQYSFMQTASLFPDTSDEFNRVLRGMQTHMYEFQVPAGSKAGMIDRMHKDASGTFTAGGYQEMLLDRGSKFRVKELQQLFDDKQVPLEDQFRIIMEVVQ